MSLENSLNTMRRGSELNKPLQCLPLIIINILHYWPSWIYYSGAPVNRKPPLLGRLRTAWAPCVLLTCSLHLAHTRQQLCWHQSFSAGQMNKACENHFGPPLLNWKFWDKGSPHKTSQRPCLFLIQWDRHSAAINQCNFTDFHLDQLSAQRYTQRFHPRHWDLVHCFGLWALLPL